jgi:hypothetical protein
MVSADVKKHVILLSFLLAVLIFTLGVILDYGLDVWRLGRINHVLESNNLDIQAYALEQEFIEYSDLNKCTFLTSRVAILKEDLKEVVEDLGTYQGKSFFNKNEFDAIKRKYVLMQLNFYTLILKANEDCGKIYFPILFFYTIDEQDSISQGYILDEFIKHHNTSVFTFALDKEFEDEPLLDLLIKQYNVEDTPTLIINQDIIKNGITYQGELESYLREFFLEDTFQEINISNNNTQNKINQTIDSSFNVVQNITSSNNSSGSSTNDVS